MMHTLSMILALDLEGKDLEHLRIGFDAIKKATENFNKKYWIGSGGYGQVYKAELEHFDSSMMKCKKESQLPKKRSTVAIKYITNNKEDTQGEQGFIAEIETLSTCNHPNIVSFLGFCLAPIVRQHYEKGTIKELVDPALNEESTFTLSKGPNQDSLKTFFVIGYKCLAEKQVHRPSIQFVIEELEKSLKFQGIKDKIMPKSLATFQRVAYECLHDDKLKRPAMNELISQLKKALEFQEDVEIWEAKLPKDYKEIVGMSKTPEIYYNLSNKNLYETFSKGILLQKGKVCFSVSNNGNRNERVSATMFSFENNVSHNKRISAQTSRFKRVVKIMDISNLNIQIKINTQFLSPNVIYGAHLVFKFCEPRKISSSKPMYVNLKYQMGSETLHAYFATCEDDDWMMVELCRFIPHKKDVEFKVLLQSMSRYYCGNGAIYVEGIYFRAINDATFTVRPKVDDKLKGAQRLLESNSDSMQQTSLDYDEITQLEDDEKLFSLGKAKSKKCHMLPARMFLYDSSNVECFNWRSCVESRFLEEVVEVLSNQLFHIKCKIEAQKLTADTSYACYLVFKLSHQCHGLHCPVKVQDVLLKKDKQFKFLYFRSPRLVNLHGNKRVPKLREDGLMEVIVWEFNSDDEWMMVELCRFIPHKKDVDFKVPLQRLSKYYCGSGAIYVESIHFRAINDATVKVLFISSSDSLL
ncbi:hypothetical protein E3N88_32936 [Mikania micrantha]|uniref:Tyrosine-protein kinase catalytic domain-containing protein n=1 Tax=Mikania micrantha TaxID=192012 RepID=A0A5N6MAH0_9ASTR|nr:hypothetical protein E3N88_32936 [Mikania micrantha]